jgi:cytochrome c nitrite reductase small subunit
MVSLAPLAGTVEEPPMRPAPAVAAAVLGIAGGLGAVTFEQAEGLSYLGEDPVVCVNCHIMRPQYDGWVKASHHGVATCNDCHLPHDPVGHYIAKGRNGWNHSRAFTLQGFPEPITITPYNAAILERNCAACHDDVLQDLTCVAGDPGCLACHPSVGHGQRALVGGPMPDPTREMP